MDFFLGLVLYGLPLPILGACIVWLFRFSLSQQKQERTARKWHDIGYARQIFVLLVVAMIGFNLYLSLGDELSALNVSSLPLSSAISEYHPVIIWSLAASILGLTYMISIRFPRRTIPT